MTNREAMLAGRIYDPGDPAILQEQAACMELLYDYNATRPLQQKLREELLKKMFAELGEGCYFEPPLRANWGGRHIHAGSFVYANFNLTAVDDGDIFLGDKTMIGPNVTIATAAHPVLPELREKGLQYNLPVHIGRNVWLGAGVTVLPGVSIGDNTVIGAGSLVTCDIPAGVVAVGSPCRVLRPIGERDRLFYHRGLRFDAEETTL